MAGRQLTPFEHILLGLICMAPSSGYDLKRIFAATPMGIYQPSSGALYPALRRLELQRAGPGSARRPDGQSARHRRVYEPTQAGRAAHADWLRTPVEPATVSRDLGLHLMRFVMMEHLFPPEEVLRVPADPRGRARGSHRATGEVRGSRRPGRPPPAPCSRPRAGRPPHQPAMGRADHRRTLRCSRTLLTADGPGPDAGRRLVNGVSLCPRCCFLPRQGRIEGCRPRLTHRGTTSRGTHERRRRRTASPPPGPRPDGPRVRAAS